MNADSRMLLRGLRVQLEETLAALLNMRDELGLYDNAPPPERIVHGGDDPGPRSRRDKGWSSDMDGARWYPAKGWVVLALEKQETPSVIFLSTPDSYYSDVTCLSYEEAAKLAGALLGAVTWSRQHGRVVTE